MLMSFYHINIKKYTFNTKQADNKINICKIKKKILFEGQRANSVDQMRWLMMSHLIWIYSVCKFNCFHFFGALSGKYKFIYLDLRILVFQQLQSGRNKIKEWKYVILDGHYLGVN